MSFCQKFLLISPTDALRTSIKPHNIILLARFIQSHKILCAHSIVVRHTLSLYSLLLRDTQHPAVAKDSTAVNVTGFAKANHIAEFKKTVTHQPFSKQN